MTPALLLDIFVNQFRVTVMPFTEDHWMEAVTQYEMRQKRQESPRLGECLSAAVAAKTGAQLIRR